MGLFLKSGVGSLSDMKHIYDGLQNTEHQRKPATSIAGRAISWLTDKLGLTKTPSYTDGYGTVRNTEVPFKDSAQGQELKRMGETAKNVGQIALIGMGLINPATSPTTAASLLGTVGQAYGLTLGAQNIYDVTKRAFNDPTSVTIPEYIFAGMDTLPFISSIETLSRGIRSGMHRISNTIHNNKPQLHEVIQGSYSTGTPNMQYRIIGKSALDDAEKVGVIRSKTGLHHDTQEYLRKNYYDALKDIPDWESKNAKEILDILDSKGVLKSPLSVDKINIRPSTNHGNTVGYFHEQTYPSYNVNLDDIIITTPGTSDRFAPGHGGKKYQDLKFGESPSATLLTTLDGGQRGAFINTASSTYWKFNKNKNKWEEFKFNIPKKTQNILDKLPIRFNIDKSGYYFRNLLQSKGAKEVLETKIIRGNPESPFKIPYFNKDYVPVPHSGDIIIKMPEVNPGWDFKWLGLTPHQTVDELYKLKVSDLIEFGKSGNTTQFTPLVGTTLNNVPLTTGASMWKRKDFLGIPYYLKKYKNGGYLTFY